MLFYKPLISADCPFSHPSFIRRVTAYEPYSQFISHHHALDEACTIHARSLPDGMLPHTPLNEFQLSRPWQPILQVGYRYPVDCFTR